MTLAEFLAARLADDEADASGCMNCGLPIRSAVTKTGYTHYDKSAIRGGWQGVRCPGKITGALPWPDPVRVLREVAAKRAILELHRPEMWCPDDDCPDDEEPHCRECIKDEDLYKLQMYPCQTVRILAAVWQDHPDYDAGWKP